MSDPCDRLNDVLPRCYSIERKLGEGGMATVYLATDLKHDRQVAIKVLKPELAAIIGAERFLAEIKTTANLQHPHILPLHDSGDAGGFLYYVMPYVEGESLRERIDREKQLPVDDAVRLAAEVADALDYAHNRGVIHRDIKPANILLQNGRALVADFGIALAVSSAGGTRLTETGLSVGTPQYMSPEQATGDRELDGRSDQYSLGCVLYEMLAGDPPHAGSTAQAIFAKILADEPRSLGELRATVPSHVAATVHRALAKLPADRWASASDFAAGLRDPDLRAGAAKVPGQAGPRWGRLAIGAAALVVAAALGRQIGLEEASEGETPDQAAVYRLVVPLPEGRNISAPLGGAVPFDISRDGEWLVYAGDDGTGRRLFLRELSSFDAGRELPGTEDATAPFFSPDGEWIGFFDEGELRRIPTDGGESRPITTAEGTPAGASWGTDGTIVFAMRPSSLFSVAETGGSPRPIPIRPVNQPIPGPGDTVAGFASVSAARWPHVLPGSRHALVTVAEGSGVVDVESGEFRYLTSQGQASYLRTGHLLVHDSGGRLSLVPFDLERLEVEGQAEPILESVFRGPGSGAAMVKVSDSGTVVYVAGGFDRTLWLVERSGFPTRIDAPPRGYRFPAASSDGSTIAIAVDPRPSDIWTLDFRGRGQPIGSYKGSNILPVWHPSGRQLAFTIGEDVATTRWPIDGDPVVISRPAAQWPTTWLGDGRVVADERVPDTGRDLIALSPDTGIWADFLVTRANEYSADSSPDGSWVVFTSDVTGTPEIYALPTSGGGSRVPVSNGGGADAKWSPDGTEVFYRRGNTIMAVPVEVGASLSVGEPVPLFSGDYDFAQERNWDPTPDGRFIMVRADPRASRQLQVVVNWFAEIENR